MKKILVLFMAAVMCISMVACNKNDQQAAESTADMTEIETEAKVEFKRQKSPEGYVIISKEEFASYLTKIELTKENWKDYLDIVEITEVERNGFGEITNSKTSTQCIAKNFLSWYFDDVAIQFKVVETGESLYCEDLFHKLYDPNSSIKWENYSIDGLACEQIVGSIIVLDNVPDECISAYEDGGKFICVGSADNHIKVVFDNQKDAAMDISLVYVIYK